mmetsp:Transcript_139556/g.197592  ORF Transcript_139556/g.197592 Transcript_139556/m.197592 type:complete len:111 (+) Transcript_139556:951-1283(+)
MWRNIKLAIAIIKTATLYVIDVPTAMAVPPLFAIAVAAWWCVWIIGFVYLYSYGTFARYSDTIPFGSVTHTNEVFYSIWAYIFFGLWTNAFLQAVCMFVLASSACIWYFS